MGKGSDMDIQEMVNKLKGHPDSNKIGVIATHLGMVSDPSGEREGTTGVEVTFDYDTMANIVNDIKKMPGIIEVIVNTTEGELHVGDEIIAVAAGGDTRGNVFSALIKVVDRIKTEATKKKNI
jgi:molybdopterin synthase catalytic subunit